MSFLNEHQRTKEEIDRDVAFQTAQVELEKAKIKVAKLELEYQEQYLKSVEQERDEIGKESSG